ncbi:MAG: gamma-glutamylcyclotransferase [Anaerolineae bacterium]
MVKASRAARAPRDWIQTPIFVYGTLRNGERNYMRLLCGFTVSEFPAQLDQAQLFSLGSFPILVDAPESNAVVHGECLILHPAAYSRLLNELDYLEGYNPLAEARGEMSLYRRERRKIRLTGGAEAMAWVYVGNHAMLRTLPHQLIAGGDWVQHQNQQAGAVRRPLFYAPRHISDN